MISTPSTTSNQTRGFIALMSTIIISSVLLLLATSGSVRGFVIDTSAVMLDAKYQSRALAEACAAQAALELAHDRTYSGTTPVYVSAHHSCDIGPVTQGANERDSYVVITTAAVADAHTTLQVTVDATTFTITALKEIHSSHIPPPP